MIGVLYEALVMKAESAEGFLEELGIERREGAYRGTYLYQRAEASSPTTSNKRFSYRYRFQNGYKSDFNANRAYKARHLLTQLGNQIFVNSKFGSVYAGMYLKLCLHYLSSD